MNRARKQQNQTAKEEARRALSVAIRERDLFQYENGRRDSWYQEMVNRRRAELNMILARS